MSGTSNSIKPKNKFFKLVKNDFLASSRLISLCYVAMAAALLIGAIARKIFMGDNIELAQKAGKVMGIALAVSMIGALVLIIATVFFVIYDFFKSLYSPQGYLSFTLPVSSNQLLGSKILVYGGWLILSFVTLFYVYFYWGNFAMQQYGEEISFVETLAMSFGFEFSVTQLVAYIVIVAIKVAVFLISGVFLIYFAITLSHVGKLQKYSIILSVLIFFVSFSVLSSIVSKSAELINISVVFSPETGKVFLDILKDGEAFRENLVAAPVTDIFTYILIDIGVFFATSYIMHKKVNIK